jgi:hypothetical protein
MDAMTVVGGAGAGFEGQVTGTDGVGGSGTCVVQTMDGGGRHEIVPVGRQGNIGSSGQALPGFDGVRLLAACPDGLRFVG